MDIYAFPYAAGSALMYKQLELILSEHDITLHAMEYPGHGLRHKDALLHDVHALAQDAFNILAKEKLDKPYFMLGYSMGSMVAYELYYMLLKNGMSLPLRMFFCSLAAPQCLKRNNCNYMDMTLDELVEQLRKQNGTPEELLQNRDFMEYLAPIVRSDFTAVNTYKPTLMETGISVPVNIVYSDEELKVCPNINEWSKRCISQCFYTNAGHGHFFINTNPELLAEIIIRYVNLKK